MFSSESRESGGLYDVLKASMDEQTGFSKGSVAELMSLENASTTSLFGVVNKILDDCIEKKNGEVTNGVARQLKKVLQLMEQRIMRESYDTIQQKNLHKPRDETYTPRKKVFETFAKRITEEKEAVTNKVQQIKIEKIKVEQRKKTDDKGIIRPMREKDERDAEIVTLKQELERVKGTYQKKVRELENLLDDSVKKLKELEGFAQFKSITWKKKEAGYKSFLDCQFGNLQELRMGTYAIKEEVLKANKVYLEEFTQFGLKVKGLVDTTQNYRAVLAENRKLYNQVQDLKGNIRVYCRIKPFLQGYCEKQTIIEHYGDNGELIVANPSKQGKDSRRVFKFNKVFGPGATQGEVFMDTQPLVRSVLDGYNVCIFAYGQTGSGKTYTMSGPSESSKEEWGVNYRALDDLFNLSEKRKSSVKYEISVQMVEIYNEQVRDLLCIGGSPKKLGISNTTQPNGLSVPDASIHLVKSTRDVLELMNFGITNRSVSATSLNSRSSRSHSIMSVHVRGSDSESDSIMRGCLHLVDLAGSERVDRSEVTGDRLREAQYINKSLSALGDVIFALSQKKSHVPYRNSKLTQVLQGSLGGQAKTLMFIQLNPDAECFSESISTLKFAERVSGIELGAARTNKDGRVVRELMEQVSILNNTVAKRDEEIGKLRVMKGNNKGNVEKHLSGQMGYTYPSQRRRSLGAVVPRPSRSTPAAKTCPNSGNGSSEFSGRKSETSWSSQSTNDIKREKKIVYEDIELLGFGDADFEETLSDISDSVLSMATETEGPMHSIVELTLFPENPKLPLTLLPPPPLLPPAVLHKEPVEPEDSEELKETVEHKDHIDCTEKSSVAAKETIPEQTAVVTTSSLFTVSKAFTKFSPSSKKLTVSSSLPRPLKRWQN